MPLTRFVAGEKLSASKLQQLGTEASYVPTLFDNVGQLDLGTSPVQSAFIWRNDNAVDIWGNITIGTTPSLGSGTNWQIALPAAYPLAAGLAHDNSPIGICNVIDASTVTLRGGVCLADVVDNRFDLRLTFDDSYVDFDNPWTWVVSDRIVWHVRYLTDLGQ